MADKEKVTYRPGWNGKPYKGDGWIVANTLIPSRKLTKKEMTDQVNAIKAHMKDKGKVVKVTKLAKGGFSVSVSDKRK
jgi:hypothetical protein